jgi:MFS transporter, FHS family, glucose/mannose:H+ symporter
MAASASGPGFRQVATVTDLWRRYPRPGEYVAVRLRGDARRPVPCDRDRFDGSLRRRPRVTGRTGGRPPAASVLGCIAFLLIGWTGLLVPSLIRSIREGFAQTDAGIGVWYFVYAVAYASGSFGGGLATERLGRRVVLSLAVALLGAGFMALALAPGWAAFLVVAVPAGLGAGVIDGGVNGLFLDLFREGRGRAMNLLHLFFSLGALSAPLAVGVAIGVGIPWQAILFGTGIAALPVALLFAVIRTPSGRHARSTEPPESSSTVRDRLSVPLLLLAFAIACYVASEVGVSSWLVRFLEPAPLEVATGALSLYWAGLTLGRLAGARLADRFDHGRFTIAAVGLMSVALVGAILVPSPPVSIALFGLAGFMSGPIFPMIIALGGERYPERSAAVSGFLAGCAVVGAVIYPPVMGFLSVTVGLTVAMLGNVVLGLACVVALALVGRPAAGPAAARS